jgi:hypothetical protein
MLDFGYDTAEFCEVYLSPLVDAALVCTERTDATLLFRPRWV